MKHKWLTLTKDSREKVIEKYPGIHPTKVADHVTLESGIKEDPKNVGAKYKFKVIGYGKDEKAEALAVSLPRKIKSKNKIPHITLSLSEGIQGKYSNEMLAAGYEKIDPFELEGEISIHDDGEPEAPDRVKIAYIIPRFFPFKGGAEENVHALSTRTALEGYDVTVVTTDVKFRNETLAKEEIVDGVKVVRNHAITNSLYSGFYPGLLPYLLKNDFDIIHTSGIGFFWREFCLIIEKITSRKKTKFITTPHGPFMSSGDDTNGRGIIRIVGTFVLKLYLNWLYDYFIEVNPKQRAWMKELYGIPDEKIVLVPNGITEGYIEKDIFEHKKSDKVVITYMNRMEWYKGIQDVIRAIAKLLDKRTVFEGDFVFYVMGKAGGYTEKLKALVEKYELGNYVKFIFHPSDEERDRIFYEESQINILPSRWEATGITLIEAMAKGNVIITTTANEASDILIKEGQNGFVYEYGNIDILKGILRKLISEYELRQRMRKKSLEMARKFTWESVMPQYLELIKKLEPKDESVQKTSKRNVFKKRGSVQKVSKSS